MKKRIMRLLFGRFGMKLAVLVWAWADEGKYDEARWVESHLLNPVQRLLGADVSSYATNQETPDE